MTRCVTKRVCPLFRVGKPVRVAIAPGPWVSGERMESMSQALVAGRSADGPSPMLRASVPVLGAVRLALAAGAFARPRRAAAGVGVADDQHDAAVPYVYALAARELALGVGAVVAWRRGRSGAGWVAAMAASDGFDAVVYTLLSELGLLDRRRARRAMWVALSGAVPETVTAVALARAAFMQMPAE